MGALDCVPTSKMQPTESTEVIAISMSSNSTLNEPQRRDLESQLTRDDELQTHSKLWTLLIDIPLFVTVVGLIGLFELGVLPNYQAGFFCNDPSLAFTYTGNTVGTGVLIATIFLAPLVVLLVTELIFSDQEYSPRERAAAAMKKAVWIYRSYLYGLIFNFAIIEVMKGIAGSPRPTFFDLCEPDTGKTCNGSEYVSTFQCTSTKYSSWMQNDSYHSFPSGHTSLSVHCGLFLAWYLQRRGFDWRYRTVFVVPVLQLVCITFTALSSLTRITDHLHHWWDVAVGFVIGVFTCSYAAFVLCRNFSLKTSNTSNSSPVHHTVKTLIFDPRTSEPVSP